MRRFSRFFPDTSLGKARLATTVFACFGTLPALVTTTFHGMDARHWSGVCAAFVLVVLFITVYVRRRTVVFEPLLTATLLVLAGSTPDEPKAIVGLSLAVLTHLSMYSTVRLAAARVALVVIAFLVSIAISPAAQATGYHWYHKVNFGLLLLVVACGVLGVTLHQLMLRLEQAWALDALLAGTGQQLISVTDLDEVVQVAGRTLSALCEGWPGLNVLVLRVRSVDAVVEAGAPVGPELLGTVLPAVCLDDVLAAGKAQARLDPEACAAVNALTGGEQQWWGLGFVGSDVSRVVLIGGYDVPAGVADALRTLATQWSLAETSCRVHAEIVHLANSDQLTELPNRRLLLERLAAARLTAAARHVAAGSETGAVAPDRSPVLLLIDLDDFKQVNDVYGHAAGDGLLVEIAARLVQAAGPNGLAARLGGDEFAVLLTDLDSPDDADRAADELRRDLLRPVRLPQATVQVGASIGLAVAAPDLTAGDFMRCADIAMYSAKAKGKNRVERFTAAHHGSVAELRRLEEHLPHAIERGELSVHYQPLVELRTGRCVGVEALARWHHVGMEPVPPETFIPLAVRTGHIKDIGAYVLRTACAQAAVWRTNSSFGDLSLSVNVAAPQLYDAAFIKVVNEALTESSLPAQQLILEISETEPIDFDRAAGTLTALTDGGVRVAVDDFGTGHTGFTMLRTFPVHRLKIDGSLISGRERVDNAMLEIVVTLGGVLHVDTVAEGVETEQQAVTLHRAGVEFGQGFLFARPMAAEDFPGWLAGPGQHLPATMGSSTLELSGAVPASTTLRSRRPPGTRCGPGDP